MEKYRNKYRIPSARLQSWDYGANGAYFITICTHNREHYFGEIVKLPTVETLQCNVSTIPTMQLSEIGKLAEQYWLEIPNHFPFIELGNFVVMPNHVHGILIINRDSLPVETLQCNVSTPTIATDTPTIATDTPTIATDPPTIATDTPTIATDPEKNEQMAKISPKSGNISTIIRSYKSVVSKYARFIHADFNWQSRFHDHIIRNSGEFERIQNYIANNPKNWNSDKFKNDK